MRNPGMTQKIVGGVGGSCLSLKKSFQNYVNSNGTHERIVYSPGCKEKACTAAMECVGKSTLVLGNLFYMKLPVFFRIP